jgi:ATP-dependent RNA helicase DHX57
MGPFAKGRPVSAGGTGLPPTPPAWRQQQVAGGANPLMSGASGFGGGGGGGGGSITGYGAVAARSAGSFGVGGGSMGLGGGGGGAAAGRPDGYWGAKPAGYGGGGMMSDGNNKRKYDDVWEPNAAAGMQGKQPKGGGKPPKGGGKFGGGGKKAGGGGGGGGGGATADGSPWHPPLRRVTVAQPALRAMRAAVDAPMPPGLLEESDVHTVSSVPDLAYLDRKAKEAGGAGALGGGGHYTRASLYAPPPPHNGGPHGAIRRSLPVFRHRQALIDAFANNPVTIVEGREGGASTQHSRRRTFTLSMRAGPLCSCPCSRSPGHSSLPLPSPLRCFTRPSTFVLPLAPSLNPVSFILLDPGPGTLHLNPKGETLKPDPKALNPKHKALNPIPYTLNTIPQTLDSEA